MAVKDYDQAGLLQLAPPKWDDLLIDVYDEEAGKVLSIGGTGDRDTLIGMQPGPCKSSFGLPSREWTPAVVRRLERRRNGRARLAS